ncbi:hypothetical protein H8E52_12100 [bacterium]|nr:hypothetical protein [bacterium]
MRRTLTILILMACAWAVSAETSSHPLASTPESSLSLGNSSLLQWGPSTLGFSQSWGGGESRSQGFLLKEFRSQLHPSLVFSANFGMSFEPSAMSGQQDGNAHFVIPQATLTWTPAENTMIRLQFSQGRTWNDPSYFGGRYGYDLGYGRPDPFGETP